MRSGRPPSDWPHVAQSRIVSAAGIDWHVQGMGEGPTILLIHGTGASTHSFRDLAPLLARSHTVVMADCPGVGFTETPRRRPDLQAMADLHGALLDKLGEKPEIIVGHSAGAVIAIEMALRGAAKPKRIVSLNGALLPFPGRAGRLFPALAKLLFLNPVVPRFFALRAHSERAVTRLLDGTGSRISPAGRAYYARLFREPRHVEGTLAMMSHWDLESFSRRLSRLDVPLLLIAAGNDLAISPRVAEEVHGRLAGSTLVKLPGLGHLAHEEAPDRVAEAILAFAVEAPQGAASPA